MEKSTVSRMPVKTYYEVIVVRFKGYIHLIYHVPRGGHLLFRVWFSYRSAGALKNGRRRGLCATAGGGSVYCMRERGGDQLGIRLIVVSGPSPRAKRPNNSERTRRPLMESAFSRVVLERSSRPANAKRLARSSWSSRGMSAIFF